MDSFDQNLQFLKPGDGGGKVGREVWANFKFTRIHIFSIKVLNLVLLFIDFTPSPFPVL